MTDLDPLTRTARALAPLDLPPEAADSVRLRARRVLVRAARTPAWLASLDLAWDRAEPALVFAMGLFYLGWAAAVVTTL